MKSTKSLLLALFLVGVFGLSACTSAMVESGKGGVSQTAFTKSKKDKPPGGSAQ